MLETAWKSIIRVTRHWTTRIGGLSTAIGISQQMGFIGDAIPVWFWWIAAIVLIFASAVAIDMKLLATEQTKPPESNMPLEEVVRRITGYADPAENDSTAGYAISAAFVTIIRGWQFRGG
jgi:cell division protein FtsW (lipid II flippase)